MPLQIRSQQIYCKKQHPSNTAEFYAAAEERKEAQADLVAFVLSFTKKSLLESNELLVRKSDLELLHKWL